MLSDAIVNYLWYRTGFNSVGWIEQGCVTIRTGAKITFHIDIL